MQYKHFWCANCQKIIKGTPYQAYARRKPGDWFVKLQFCDQRCFRAYEKKKGVTG